MSSPIEQSAGLRARKARRAAGWVRMSSMLTWVVACAGVLFLGVFLLQAGFFAALMPAAPRKPLAIENPGDVTSEKARISGVDKNGKSYWVTAARLSQDETNTDVTHLETVVAQFAGTSDRLYDVTARTGDYDKRKDSVDLKGDVVIRQGQRFTAKMDSANVQIKKKDLSSTSPVTVTLGNGWIESRGLQITNDGDSILFFNGVRARFGAEAQKGDLAQ